MHGLINMVRGQCFFVGLVPLIRSLISIPAGMSNMNFPLFILLDNNRKFNMEWNSSFNRRGSRRQLGIDRSIYGYLFEHCVRIDRIERNSGNYLVYSLPQKESVNNLWNYLNY